MASDCVSVNAEKKPFTVLIEGNVGCGKSSLLGHFSTKFPSQVESLSEPVDRWRDVCGHNLLQLMYEDPSRWSLAFQSYVQLTMMDVHLKATTKPIKMMERSIFSGRHCFVENLYRSGKLPASEYSVLKEWYTFLTSAPLSPSADLIVYLRTDPQVAYERILRRARSEEKVVPLEYIQAVHELHEEWLMHPTGTARSIAPVLVIDANEDVGSVDDLFARYEHEILGAVSSGRNSAVKLLANGKENLAPLSPAKINGSTKLMSPSKFKSGPTPLTPSKLIEAKENATPLSPSKMIGVTAGF